MSEDLEKLERDLDAAMASLPDLSVAVPDALILRTKATVRHAINEEWLAAQAGPLPSAEAVRQVHDAVRQELTRPAARLRVWSRIISPLAAAAMIALCVGVIRQAGMLKQDTSPVVLAAEQHVDRFLTAAEEAFSSDTLTEAIHDELSEIEEDIDGWRSAGSGETGGLGDVLQEIDTQIKNSPKSMSRALGKAQGVLG
jgi:hypothetical protein